MQAVHRDEALIRREPDEPLIALDGIDKTYGPTRANRAVSLSVRPGEIVGLIGANGAGKSTLMRILTGITAPDAGSFALDGRPVDLAAYGPRESHRLGIRMVHQELSLCPNLTAAENFFLEQPEGARARPFWQQPYRAAVRQSLVAIFPGVRIDPDARVGRLDIARRQMLEIARAACDPRLRLLILDEPTSSLGSVEALALHDYIRARAAGGLAVIFISHKLQEVLAIAGRVVAMRNGAVVWDRPRAETGLEALVEAVGGAAAQPEAGADIEARSGEVLVRLSGELTAPLGRPVDLRAGEVVGLAGLEGGGQKALLRRLFARSTGGDATRTGRASFVSGDRQAEGVFPLWSVRDNISIGRTGQRAPAAVVDERREEAAARDWAGRLALAPDRLPAPILSLSGGNQQKALMARGLVDGAPVVLLNDPTRGVDIGAKRDFYRALRGIAGEGRLVLWHSTEDAELLECDRVLVLAGGCVVAELTGDAIREEAIIGAGFATPIATTTANAGQGGEWLFQVIPFLALALLVVVMGSMNPRVISSFGMELLLAPAVVLVLVSLAQMFVVGGSEIDLGVGAFAGMVNVLSATLLVASPLLGLGALVAALAGYAAIALLIHGRGIPAIVVTLGASFIWSGIGETIQPTPGGSAPDWLRALVTWSVAGVPTPLLLILMAGLAAMAIDRAPLGVVLRGFGASPDALARTGWNPIRYAVWRYLIAGSFAMAAGLYLTAANRASDINAGGGYTLLSVAGVVIGGCALLGGRISPWGVVAGAVTLSLIGAALATLGVSTDFNALVQGGLLIAILGLRSLVEWRRGRG